MILTVRSCRLVPFGESAGWRLWHGHGSRTWAIRAKQLRENLGISLEARGEYEPAIEAWITATRVYPEDPRSLGHLERLLEEQPHLERGLGLGTAIEDCRRAVGQAAVRAGRGRGTR